MGTVSTQNALRKGLGLRGIKSPEGTADTINIIPDIMVPGHHFAPRANKIYFYKIIIHNKLRVISDHPSVILQNAL